MTFNEYQTWTRITAKYPENKAVDYCVLGLTNESGEVAGKLKKVYRDNDGILDEIQREKLMDECSDVLWYLARLLDELGYKFDDVAEFNRNKLMSRLERNAIQGSGDNR